MIWAHTGWAPTYMVCTHLVHLYDTQTQPNCQRSTMFLVVTDTIKIKLFTSTESAKSSTVLSCELVLYNIVSITSFAHIHSSGNLVVLASRDERDVGLEQAAIRGAQSAASPNDSMGPWLWTRVLVRRTTASSNNAQNSARELDLSMTA